jgi:aryl-alcohol dehydrogenase-like predicted oxidoreductase
MALRPLGQTGLQVSSLCFGGNVFGWTADETMSFQLLDRLSEAGINFIDTADVYSRWAPGHQGGESETILGKWFQRSGKREKVILATKVGMEMGPTDKGLSATYIEAAVERSLKRLQTDYIDLYQTHQDDESTPLDETLTALSKLIERGKVRAIGASNYVGKRLKESLEVSHRKGLPAFQTLQPLYNLYDREPFESDLEPICREAGLGVITYFSLGAGFLTGKYRSEADLSKSPRGKTVKKYLNQRGERILKALDAVAAESSSTPGQVALAWLLTRPVVTAPIVSATTVEQLEDLIDSTLIHLSADQLRTLDQASQ